LWQIRTLCCIERRAYRSARHNDILGILLLTEFDLSSEENLKHGFIANVVGAPEGTAKDRSLLDDPSFQCILTLVLLLELAGAAWVFLVWHTHTSEMAMATGLPAAHFLMDWVIMMVAMMFPAAAVMVFAFYKARAIRHAEKALGSTWVFVTAYLLLWAAAGIAAYGGVLATESAAVRSALSPVTAFQFEGAILLLAGLYQFTPLKEKCLSECRTPIDMTTWHHDTAGSFHMGLLHGVYCIGCNWLLFATLFPLGMTIGAMAVITLVILAEKTLPWPRFASYTAGVVLVLYGALLIASPQVAIQNDGNVQTPSEIQMKMPGRSTAPAVK
jgi:predicted metal-binding membrane protein